MRNSIIYTEKGSNRIIGNVNFSLPNLAEIRLISPYNGFVLQGEKSVVNHNAERAEEDYLNELLERAFEICEQFQQKSKNISSDFLKLQDTLLKFNNTKKEDFQRNRDELMKVFISNHLPEMEEKMIDFVDFKSAVYHFLNSYYAENGSFAAPDFRTKFKESAEAPEFEQLQTLLSEYLEKSKQEKIEMIASQILTGNTGTYDWFLQQEFFRINNKEHNNGN